MTAGKRIKPTIDFIYNPDNQTKEQLIDSFVVRLKTFKRLFSDIKEAPMKSPEQHYLIEGKRGMGKTTLLLRLGYEVENDPALNKWLLPIVFNEEEYSIRRLYKLWERIAILLEEKCALFLGLHTEMDESYPSFSSDEEYEYAIFNLLNRRLEEKGKKLILFIDNFGDIFLKFNPQEVQRLRTVLQTNTNFRIFGASSTVLEAFYDVKHPFFEFFKTTRLRGLNKQEAIELLLKLGEAFKQEQIKEIIATQAGRVEALRRLTGGVIRTIVLLFEIFIDKKEGSAFTDLEAILDRVTPLYKHRMDDLPAQQQEIVQAIAFAWDAVNVKEISQKTKIPSKTVSAQLRQMEKNEIIAKKQTNIKNHFYQINERFFNIWYLMRHGRKGDKRKVLWLVRFLEEWCDEGELVERAQLHIDRLKKGKYHINGAYYLGEALAGAKAMPSETQDELIKVTREFLSQNNSELAKYLSESDLELLEKMNAAKEKEDYKNALVFLLKMKKKDNFRIGYYHTQLNNPTKAEKFYLLAVQEGHSYAMYNLGVLYHSELKDFQKAEKFYLLAVKEGYSDAMFNLALLYQSELKDFQKAEKFYLMTVQKGHSGAMNNLGVLYEFELKDFQKAEKFYLLAVQKGDSYAMNNLGLLYHSELKDFQKAEKFYLMAIKKGNSEAMFPLAYLYYCEKIKSHQALNLAEQAYKSENKNPTHLVYANNLLWNNQSKESQKIAQQFLHDEKFLTKYLEQFSNYLYLLLAKKQYQFLYDYFTSPKAKELQLKDRLKPIWYALLYYLQDKYPNEYLRMGEELEETVKEIIKKVEQMAIDYAL